MAKLKKPILVAAIILIILGIAAAVYLLVIKKVKNTTNPASQPISSQEAADNAPVDHIKEIDSVGGVYSDAESAKFTAAAMSYFTEQDFAKMDDVLNKIPSTAKLAAVGIKYKLTCSKYLQQKDQPNYLKCREEYKAILKTRSATDKVAKQILTDFDKIYPVDTAPTVTYPEGEEVR